MLPAMDPAQAPIFVVGTGRSGTTLLRLMLCAHPRIYITHEASFYMWEALYLKRAPRRAFLEHYFQSPWFRWLRIDPERVMAGLPDPLPREQIGAAYAAIMREKAGGYGRVRYGDKTPNNAMYLARIFRDFPGAKVVRIIRDPRGVVQSLTRMPWASSSLHASAHFCESERRAVARYRDRMLTIRLEDLLADPRTVMSQVLAYVGEPWDDAVLDHSRHLPDDRDMPPFPWLESAARDRTPASAQSAQWKGLSPAQIRLIEDLTKGAMAEGNYERATFEREPSRLSVLWEGTRQIPEALRFMWVYARIGMRLRDPQNFETDETNAIWRRLNPPSWSRYPGFELPAAPPLRGTTARALTAVSEA
jgi:hypothetical protein